MNFNQISPYVRLAMRSVLPSGFYIKSRIIFDYELIYVEYGSFQFLYNSTSYDVKPGEILLILPGISHCFNGIGQSEVSQPHIHFDMVYDQNSETVEICFRDIDALLTEERKLIRQNLFPGKHTPFLHPKDRDAFLHTFYSLIDTYEKKEEYAQLSCKAKMTELITEMLRSEQHGAADSEHRYDITVNLKNYLDENYSGKISLEKLEMQFNYNKYYLLRKFRKKYGVSIIEYSNRLKHEHAKKLLQGDAPIHAIAEQLGFSSIYSFSRFFSAREGISPQGYRKKM